MLLLLIHARLDVMPRMTKVMIMKRREVERELRAVFQNLSGFKRE